MIKNSRLILARLWLCALTLLLIGQFRSNLFAQGNLTLSQPTYNCSTGAITFNTSGGNGSPITYSAAGVTRNNEGSSSGTVEQGLRTDPKPLVITATQSGNSTSYTFDVAAFCAAPANRAPVYNGSITTSTGTVGRTFYYYIPTGAFTDPDGQQLSYSATGLPTGFLIDPPTGTVYGTATSAGSNVITITATDPGGLSASGQLLVGFSPTSGTTVGGFTLTQPTYNCTTGAITLNSTGGDGSAITYSAPGITRTSPTSSTGTVEPGLIADPKTLIISAVQGGFVSIYSFDLAAFCRNGGVNLAPVFSGSLAATSGITGVPFTYNLPTGAFTDPNAGQSLTYTATSLPAGLSLNSATGAITGTPSTSGTNSVVIRATDTGGLSASGTLGLTISTNQAPVSTTLISATTVAGFPFSYTLPTGAFTDPNTGQSLSYVAVTLPLGLSLNPATGAITGTPSATGTNSVTLTATDTGGLSTSSILGIFVTPNLAPTFSGSLVSATAIAGSPFSYTLPTGSFVDPNTGQILTYTVAGLPTGLTLNPTTGGITGTASATGTNSLTLTAADAGGLSTTGLLGLTVVPNVAPVFSGSIASVTGTVGSLLTYTFPATAFTDANPGQSLSYAAIGLPTGLSLNGTTRQITGTPSTSGTSSATVTATDAGGLSTTGTLGFTINPNRAPVVSNTLVSATGVVGSVFSYTIPANTFTDADAQSFSYSATGLPAGLSLNAGAGTITGTPSASGVSSVTITATDTGSASVGSPLTITINANTAPAFSGTLASATATVGSVFSYTLPTGSFTDANGQTLSYVATGLPAGLSLNTTNGAITGTPSASGTSSVTITATDTGNASANSSFSITVNANTAPAFSGTLSSATGVVGQAFSYTLPTGAFTDANGQTLAYAATGLPAGLSLNAATGTITGTPTTAGNSTVTLRATDTGNLSASTTLGINIIGTPTFSGSLVSATGTVGQAFSYTLPANAFANGGQPLTYAATGLPTGLSLNAATGAITGTPSASGTNSVTLTATNTATLSASGTVGITISNSVASNAAPVVSGSLVSATGTVGQSFTYALPTGAFTDPEGQTLTYSASGLPAGLSVNAGTGALTGTPSATGTSAVVIRATDTGGLSASSTLGITISSSVTSGTSTTGTSGTGTSTTGTSGTGVVFSGSLVSATVVVGRGFSYTLPAGAFTGPTGQTLTYAATGLPAGMSINAATGVISGTPTTVGSNTVVIRATSSTVTSGTSTTGTSGTSTSGTSTVGQSASGVLTITVSASTAGGRMATEMQPIDIVATGGNPISNGIVEVAITGATGETIQVMLTDSRGRVIGQQQRAKAGAEERFRFDVGNQPSGTLLLRAATPTRANTVRLLKVD